MKLEKDFTWRQITNSIIYDTFYNLEDLIDIYSHKVEKSNIYDPDINGGRKRTPEEKDKAYHKLSELLVERYKYNPENVKRAQLRGGDDTKFTDKKLVISGNIVELYEYSKELNYDFRSLIQNRKEAYHGLEGEELEQKIKDNQIKSRQRTLKNYKRLINCNINHFQRFFTGTFAPFLEPEAGNFQDLSFTNGHFKEFIKRVKRYFKEVKNKELDLHYIATVEPQKQVTWNIHYHVLTDLPFIENRPSELNKSESEYIKNKLENIRSRKEANKKVYGYELRVLKLYEHRRETQGVNFKGIGLLDFLWSWGSVDYKRIVVQRKGDKQGIAKTEKAYHGNMVNRNQKGLNVGSYMAKNIGDYMIKNLTDDGESGKEFLEKIENKKLYLASTNLNRPIEILNKDEVENYIKANLSDDKFISDFEFENTFISGKISRYNLNGVYDAQKKRYQMAKQRREVEKKKEVSKTHSVYDPKHFFVDVIKGDLLYRDGKEIIKIKESEFDYILKLDIKQQIRSYIIDMQMCSK